MTDYNTIESTQKNRYKEKGKKSTEIPDPESKGQSLDVFKQNRHHSRLFSRSGP